MITRRAAVVLWAWAWGAGCTPAEPGREPGLVRLQAADAAEANQARAWFDDVWSEGPTDHVLGLVAASRLPSLPDGAEVVAHDIDALVAATSQPFGDGFYEAWSDLGDLEARMESLAADHDTVERIEIGTSHEGRTVWGLRIARHVEGDAPRPSMMVTGGVHAREWVAVHSALYVAERLATDDGLDPEVTEILDTQRVVVVPVVNPDGYRYTWTTDRLWRKNRRDNGDGSFGVDLNRNFAVGHGGVGASASTTSNNYHGPAPLSEPEAEAVAAWLADHPRTDRHVDLHCTGQLSLVPWSHSGEPAADEAELVEVAADAAEAMEAVEGVPYDDGVLYTRLYPAAGTLIDHAYGAHGMTSLLVELRDRGEYGFLLPAEQLLPTAMEAWAAVRTVLARSPLRLSLSGEALGDETLLRVRRVGEDADGQQQTEVWIAASRDGAGATVTGLGPDLELAGAVVFGPFPVFPHGATAALFRPPASWEGDDIHWQAFTASLRSPVWPLLE